MVAAFNRSGDKILSGDSKGYITVIDAKTFEVYLSPLVNLCLFLFLFLSFLFFSFLFFSFFSFSFAYILVLF